MLSTYLQIACPCGPSIQIVSVKKTPSRKILAMLQKMFDYFLSNFSNCQVIKSYSKLSFQYKSSLSPIILERFLSSLHCITSSLTAHYFWHCLLATKLSYMLKNKLGHAKWTCIVCLIRIWNTHKSISINIFWQDYCTGT